MHTHHIPTPNINLPGSFQAALAPGGQVVLQMDWVQTQVLNAKRQEMRKLDVFKMAAWATSYIDHLTLTDEWGGAHVWWARFGGSWKVFHRFFETLHLVLHTGLKEANTQHANFRMTGDKIKILPCVNLTWFLLWRKGVVWQSCLMKCKCWQVCVVQETDAWNGHKN